MESFSDHVTVHTFTVTEKPTKYIQRAISGVLENISADGRVLNVSGGTAVMRDREGYRNISRDWIQGWGQGLALAFLSGVLGCGD